MLNSITAVLLFLAVTVSRADDAEQIRSPTSESNTDFAILGVEARPATLRPADEIVSEIEEQLKITKRSLPAEEFLQTHRRIATLVGELRTKYPDDHRVAKFLPKRWLSLRLVNGMELRHSANHFDMSRALDAEIGEILSSTKDSVLKSDAHFFQIAFRIGEPMDGLAAVSLAETFARQWPDDNRAGELLYNSAAKLDVAWYTRIVLVVLLIVIGGVSAATARRRLDRQRKRRTLVILVGLLGLVTLVIALVAGAQQSAFVAAVAPMLLRQSSQFLLSVVWTSRVGIAVGLAGTAALILAVVQRRFAEASTQRMSAARLWFLFFMSLAVCCTLDAYLIARKKAELAQHIVRDYPDSFRGRMVQGQVRQRKGIGQPFELQFNDAISGRPVSMKQLRGKVVVVDFWATSCGPCVRAMPELKRLYAQYHDQGVEFIGVSQDLPEEDGGLEALKAFVAKEQIPWPQFYEGRDPHALLTGSALGDFSESWGIEGIPTVFLIDSDGKVYSTEAQGKLELLIPKLLNNVQLRK